MTTRRLLPLLAAVAALANLPTLAAEPPSQFLGPDRASRLSETGWRHFNGQGSGRAIPRSGLTLVGQPLQHAAFVTLDPNGAKNWFGGLARELPAMPAAPLDKLRLAGRVAASKPGPVSVRVESSPNNWIGFVFTLPTRVEWMDFDWPLSEAITQGRFDPASEKLRLVIAFRDAAGPVWSASGENTLYVADIALRTP